MDKLLKVLESVRPDIDFANATKLIDDHMLDSFDIIQIVNELNEAYDIEINVSDLEPDNFNDVGAILKLVEKLANE